jgi:tetratricopeptide (TPR) repeat protein
LLRKMCNPVAIERDPYALRLRDGFGTRTAREAVRAAIERALHEHDPLFSAIIRRCDLEGAPTRQVARELYVSHRQFFRYRAQAVEAIGIALDRMCAPERASELDSHSEEARRAFSYATYLLVRRSDPRDKAAALRWLDVAVRADPEYLDAWIGISSANLSLLLAGVERDPAAAFRRAAYAVDRASALQPDAGRVEAERAALALWSGAPRRSVQALAESALARDPLSARAYYVLGWTAVFERDYELARQRFIAASTAHIVGSSCIALANSVLFFQKRYAEAAARSRECLELEPDDAYVIGYLAEALNAEGRFAETIATLAPDIAAGRANYAAQAAYVRALAMAGDVETARRIADAYDGPSVPRAAMRVSLDDFDGALAALLAARFEGDGMIRLVDIDPAFDALRDDRRFKDLLERRAG